jgi:hypothetical protein
VLWPTSQRSTLLSLSPLQLLVLSSNFLLVFRETRAAGERENYRMSTLLESLNSSEEITLHVLWPVPTHLS